MLKSSVYGRVAKHLSLFFIFMATLSIVILSHTSSTLAVESSATATVHVAEACSLTADVTDEHSDEMSNGTYTDSLGETKFTVKCNDSAGFALYAIGYSGDTYGATSMLGDNELSIPTGTDALNGNTTSHWSMKISKDTSSYLPANLTIENNFDSQHIIPDTYTKIASYSANTDGVNGTGSSIFATYGVRISNTQPANTYIGKVKYTLVHPNMVDNSNKPVYPLAEEDCPTGYVCYAPNANDIEGSMSSLGAITSSDRAGKVNLGKSATTANLIAPNYKRSGYGFAGWSTSYDATTATNPVIYGPNETIAVDLSNSGLILYPVWIASTGNLQNWDSCSSLVQATYNSTNNKMVATLSSITALTDTRDGNVYAIARLADDRCWMIENLRLDDTAIITTTNTNNPLHDTNNTVILNASGTTAAHLSTTSNSWCTNNSASCFNQTMLNTNNTNPSLTASYNNTSGLWYSYGNYYNWYSATAGNGTYDKSGYVNGDLCPAGWHLPYGGNRTSTDGGNTAGGFYYLNTQMSGSTSAQGSKDWLMFPNNFIYNGRKTGNSTQSRGSYGYYCSSWAANDSSAYYFNLGSSFISPTISYYKSDGYSIRCVAESTPPCTGCYIPINHGF